MRYQRTKVDKPYFVTPHAVSMFRDRVRAWSDQIVIEKLNVAMQYDSVPIAEYQYNDTVGQTHLAIIENVPFYVALLPGEKAKGNWPTIVTILPIERGPVPRGRKDNARIIRPRKYHSTEDAVIRVLRARGWYNSAIGEVLARSGGSVSCRCHTLGIHRRRAQRIGINKPWTQDDVDIAFFLWCRGMNCQKIGDVVGRGSRSVERKILSIGLVRRREINWTKLDEKVVWRMAMDGATRREISDAFSGKWSVRAISIKLYRLAKKKSGAICH